MVHPRTSDSSHDVAFDCEAPHGHANIQPLPQSISSSVPFLTPSMQLGGSQAPALHTPERQSDGARHAALSAHFFPIAAHVPPQSSAVSSPLRTVSLHVPATHVPALHDPKQSACTEHVFPSAHGPHCGPPQSTSDSMPFFAVSLHSIGRHRLAWHTAVTHSSLASHSTHAVVIVPQWPIAFPQAVSHTVTVGSTIGGIDGSHVLMRHGFDHVYRSAIRVTYPIAPMPSHWASLQSPTSWDRTLSPIGSF